VLLGHALDEVHARAPVFSTRPTPTDQELREALAEDVASPDIGILVAESDGRVAGVFEIAPIELSSTHTGLARPSGQCLLSFGATLPEVRGRGLGRALTAASMSWAHAAGYTTMVTDWRATNLLASRFWPARFDPAFLRLYRSVP
jgi:GNAT superfamily N-acetyltransferase